jgi:hypothetical protein
MPTKDLIGTAVCYEGDEIKEDDVGASRACVGEMRHRYSNVI